MGWWKAIILPAILEKKKQKKAASAVDWRSRFDECAFKSVQFGWGRGAARLKLLQMQYVMKIALLSGKQVVDDPGEWQKLNKKCANDWDEVDI